MPKMRICSRIGCSTLVPIGTWYCVEHKQPIQWNKFTTSAKKGDIKSYGPQWKQIRKIVLERDEHTCRKCNGKGNTVHHIIPHVAGNDHDIDNLITLCRKCHNRITLGSTHKKPMRSWYVDPPSYLSKFKPG